MPAHSPQPPASSHAIVTDAAADVPEPERANPPGGADIPWHVLPELWWGRGLELTDFGEQSLDLVRLVLGPAGMEVTEPGVEHFRRLYADLSGVGTVWSVHGSVQVSPSVTHARTAAADFPNVRVVECAAAGLGVGLVAARLRSLIATGIDGPELEQEVEARARSVRFMVVPDRFDPAGGQRTFTATLLSGRPMLSARDGTMARSRRLRSRRATVAAIGRYLEEHSPEDRPLRLAVGHGDASGAVDPFLDIVERVRPRATIELVGRIGPRLVGQLGTRCVGLALLTE